MRRFLVFLEPVEVLDFSPKVRLANSLLLLFVGLSGRILEAINSEDDSITVFDDSLAGHKDTESRIKGVVDAKLMTIKLESASNTIVYENCRFSDCTTYLAIFQVFQK